MVRVRFGVSVGCGGQSCSLLVDLFCFIFVFDCSLFVCFVHFSSSFFYFKIVRIVFGACYYFVCCIDGGFVVAGRY